MYGVPGTTGRSGPPAGYQTRKDGYLGRLPKDVVAQVGRIDRRA